jgi:anti-anti-sigma regulatory factor
MSFRIEAAARGKFTVLALSGRIETQAIAELKRLLERRTDYRDVVLDLKDVSMIGRDGVGFLARCEEDGVTLENCTAYIREWMEREKDRS